VVEAESWKHCFLFNLTIHNPQFIRLRLPLSEVPMIEIRLHKTTVNSACIEVDR